MRIMLLLLLIVVLVGDGVLVYISSLYAPDWFWALAYATLLGTSVLGLFYRKNSKGLWILALIGSLIINSHYMITAFSAPSLQVVVWAIALFIAQSLLLFLILNLAAKLTAR